MRTLLRRCLVLLPLAILIWLCSLHSGDAQSPDADAIALAESLPDTKQLKADYSLPEGIQTSPLGDYSPKDKKAEVDAYREKIAELASRYAKLKPHFAVGTSILIFPGILSKGQLDYDRKTNLYELQLGVFDEVRWAGYHGTFGPYRIFFDNSGKIASIKDVVYKK